MTSRVIGVVTIFVTGDRTGIVVRGVLGLASPSPSDSPAVGFLLSSPSSAQLFSDLI
jgi:hypothetical protein